MSRPASAGAEQRGVILTLLFLSTVLNYLDRQALSVLFPTLRTDLELSSEQYGSITAAFMVAYGVTQVFAGRLMDAIGARTGLALSVLLWSAAAVGHALVQGFGSLALVRMALGVCEAGNWPAGGKVIAERFPAHRRAFAMGVFDAGSALGAVLAPPVVAALALGVGWRASFLVLGSLGLLWAVAWLALFRPTAPGLDGRWQPPRVEAPVRSLLALRSLWGLMITRLIATPVWWFYVFWLPDYLSRGRQFSLREIGLFGWIPFLTVDCGKLAGGILSDGLLSRGVSVGVARKSVMVLAALAMAAGLRVVGADSAAQALAWVSIATFGFGMWSANILALHADLFPPAAMGTAVGLTGSAASLGGAAVTFLVGGLVERYGYAPAFWVAGSLALFALVALFALLKDIKPVHLEMSYAIRQ
jgi:ACS family hexuronate transporter-like MFS transporter